MQRMYSKFLEFRRRHHEKLRNSIVLFPCQVLFTAREKNARFSLWFHKVNWKSRKSREMTRSSGKVSPKEMLPLWRERRICFGMEKQARILIFIGRNWNYAAPFFPQRSKCNACVMQLPRHPFPCFSVRSPSATSGFFPLHFGGSRQVENAFSRDPKNCQDSQFIN